MLAAERMSRIVEILNKERSAKVEDLAHLLDVSEMTIRRDLEKCRRAGIIDRCHGGAVLKEESMAEICYADKSVQHQDEKQRLALFCATLVQPGDSVYLDAGTTTFEIAKLLGKIPGITVITNDLETALLLSGSEAEVLVIGGIVQKSTGSLLGQTATQAVQGLRASVAFIGAACINNDLDVMTPTMEKAFLKRAAAQCATESYLVVDASKFHRQALYKINHLSDYTGVVTTRDFGAQEQRRMAEEGVQLIHIE